MAAGGGRFSAWIARVAAPAGRFLRKDPTIPAIVARPARFALTAAEAGRIVAGEAAMDVRIAARGRMLLVGMAFFGDPFAKASAWDEENEIGSLWKRFFALLESGPGRIPDRIDAGTVGYELHIAAPDTNRTGRYEVFVGVEVSSLEAMPVSCVAKILPAADYAAITVRGDEIRGDWMGRLYSEIVPGLGRTADTSFSFERYDERFKGMDRLDESEIEYYVPLAPPAGRP